jgi:hypothetical protein
MRSLAALSLALVGCSVDTYGTTPNPDGTTDTPTGGAGTLQISATASPTAGGGGQYNPSNIVAIWIEGPAGTTFVKTIGRWAATRKQHLVAWNTAAGTTDADAVSGATRASYTPPLTATWNLQNRQGQVVPDGMYTIRMESTDLNATLATQNNQGTFTFMKSASPQMQTALSNGGFSNVSITFTP